MPAVLLALDRRPRVRARRGALRQRRRGRQLQRPRLRAVRWPHKNQCGDPPEGEALAPPERRRRLAALAGRPHAGDPTGLNGTVIRIDPDTGEGLPGNPLPRAPTQTRGGSSPSASATRSASRSTRETGELYVDNVGWRPRIEEIDRFGDPPSTRLQLRLALLRGRPRRIPASRSLELDLCESLYDERRARPRLRSSPTATHQAVSARRRMPDGSGSAITGSIFYEGERLPGRLRRRPLLRRLGPRLHLRDVPGADGRPDPSTVTPFLTDGGIYPGVDIQEGPEGDLYYASLFGEEFGPGAIHRIAYFSGNQPPVARLDGRPRMGRGDARSRLRRRADRPTPTAKRSTYEWDLDGDGTFEAPTSRRRPETDELHRHRRTTPCAVRVSDQQGATSVARVTVYPGDTPPRPAIVDAGNPQPGSASRPGRSATRSTSTAPPPTPKDEDQLPADQPRLELAPLPLPDRPGRLPRSPAAGLPRASPRGA